MTNVWVGGLVLVLGWLSLRAADPTEEVRPAPLVAPAGSWAERPKPKHEGITLVSLGRPVAVSPAVVSERVPAPVFVVRNNPGEAAVLASTAPTVRQADTSRRVPTERALPNTINTYVPTSVAVPIVRGQSPDEPPATEAQSVARLVNESAVSDPQTPPESDGQPLAKEMEIPELLDNVFAADRPYTKPAKPNAAPSKETSCVFAAERPTSHTLLVRASGFFESPNLFAADRSAARRKADTGNGEPKRASFAEAAGCEPASEAAPSSEEDPSPVAQGIIARTKRPLLASAAAPSGVESQDLPPLPKDDPEAAPSAEAKAPEAPEAPRADTVEKPTKPSDKAARPTETADGKAAKEPIAATPSPRLMPQSIDCTTAKIGTPRVTPSEEADAPGRLYGSAEYLLWFTKGGHVPPLVTTGPAASNGILGQPGTVILFGGPGTTLNNDVRQGGRFTLGYWLDPCRECAIEGSFFFLEDETTRFRASSDAFPLLARPFFRINTGSEFSEISTRPDLTSGNIHIEAPTSLWGAELNARHNLCCGCTYRVDGLLGVRYLDLKDGLHITEDLVATPTLPVFANDTILVADRFDTHNQFYGGQLGVDAEVRRGRFFVDFRGKVALGDNHETLDIQGGQTIITPQGNVQNFRGGLLALSSNIGHFTRDRFSVVPEIGLSVGYQVTEQLRVSVGYNILWWTNVLRAGDQIDRVLDETLIPNFGAIHPPAGQNRPAVLFKETDYWAQGVTFGVEFRY